MRNEEIIVTKEGFKKLNEELRNLIDVVLPEVIEQLKEARAQGDLSENADYDAARNRQAEVEGKIAQLQHQIENAKIIDDSDDKSANVVKIGFYVTIRDLSDGSETRYQIVGSTESDPVNLKISNECMLAKSILGHKVGEVVQVKVVRPYDVEILKIEA
ncbi:MAG: transcription elongation factor GreA [Erysipelotrichaceae bacterium]|nr:transcription elongation factor GreA [Erysipelotrichaceae bacterium]